MPSEESMTLYAVYRLKFDFDNDFADADAIAGLTGFDPDERLDLLLERGEIKTRGGGATSPVCFVVTDPGLARLRDEGFLG
jgi:hypothetical protein